MQSASTLWQPGIDPQKTTHFYHRRMGSLLYPEQTEPGTLGISGKNHGAARCRYIPYSRAKMMGDASYRFPEYFYRRWEVGQDVVIRIRRDSEGFGPMGSEKFGTSPGNLDRHLIGILGELASSSHALTALVQSVFDLSSKRTPWCLLMDEPTLKKIQKWHSGDFTIEMAWWSPMTLDLQAVVSHMPKNFPSLYEIFPLDISMIHFHYHTWWPLNIEKLRSHDRLKIPAKLYVISIIWVCLKIVYP